MFEVFSTDIWGTNQNNLNKFDRHSPMEHLYEIFEIGPLVVQKKNVKFTLHNSIYNEK